MKASEGLRLLVELLGAAFVVGGTALVVGLAFGSLYGAGVGIIMTGVALVVTANFYLYGDDDDAGTAEHDAEGS